MSKTPFKLRSGNTTPFKEMGAMDSVVQNEIGSEIENVKETDENFASESSENSNQISGETTLQELSGINDQSKVPSGYTASKEGLAGGYKGSLKKLGRSINQGNILEDPSLQNA